MEKIRKNCEPVELYPSAKDSRIEKIVKRVNQPLTESIKKIFRRN